MHDLQTIIRLNNQAAKSKQKPASEPESMPSSAAKRQDFLETTILEIYRRIESIEKDLRNHSTVTQTTNRI